MEYQLELISKRVDMFSENIKYLERNQLEKISLELNDLYSIENGLYSNFYKGLVVPDELISKSKDLIDKYSQLEFTVSSSFKKVDVLRDDLQYFFEGCLFVEKKLYEILSEYFSVADKECLIEC